jgi:hypothetical protein
MSRLEQTIGVGALTVDAGVLTHHVPWRGDGMTAGALSELLHRLRRIADALDLAAIRRSIDPPGGQSAVGS